MAMIDQTTLVQDVISLQSGFTVVDVDDRESDHSDEECALDFSWMLIDSKTLVVPCDTEVVGSCDGILWAGTLIH